MSQPIKSIGPRAQNPSFLLEVPPFKYRRPKLPFKTNPCFSLPPSLSLSLSVLAPSQGAVLRKCRLEIDWRQDRVSVLWRGDWVPDDDVPLLHLTSSSLLWLAFFHFSFPYLLLQMMFRPQLTEKWRSMSVIFLLHLHVVRIFLSVSKNSVLCLFVWKWTEYDS